MLFYFLGVFFVLFFILQGIAFFTVFERHLLGGSQFRVGPNKVSFMGILQGIFDGVKLVMKEQVLLSSSGKYIFLGVPVGGFGLMFMIWYTLPYFVFFVTFDESVFFLFCVLSIFGYVSFLGGLFGKSKYSLIGGLRGSIQSYSYEIAMSLFFLSFLVVISGYYFPGVVSFLLYFFLFFLVVLFLADLHRAPFDFTECESELVSGYNVEYSSVGFALFFLGEYGMLLYFSLLLSGIFFDFSFFIFFFFISLFILIRTSFPRLSYDKLMSLCWLEFLPLGIFFLLFFCLFSF